MSLKCEDIINNYDDFLWEVDNSGKYKYISNGIENILGYKKEEVLGKKPFDFMSEKQADKIKTQIKNRISKSSKFKYLKSAQIHKKGHTVYLESSGVAIKDKEGNILGFKGVSKDISYKTTLENSLIQKSKELDKLNKQLKEALKQRDIYLEKQAKVATMGEVLEGIIHQWRQPLSTISTTSSGLMLQKEHNLLNEETLDDSLNLIKDTSIYLSDVVEDFRDFYQSSDIKREFDIESIFTRTTSLLPKEFSQITFIKDIDDIRLFAYDTKIVQILMNIIMNANDEFKAKKQEKRLIFFNAYKDENFCVIKIKDNAGGIKQNLLDKVLNCRVTTKKQGTGLGLCLCKQILSNHLNGTIKVINKTYNYNGEKYSGAEFIIKVPINLSDAVLKDSHHQIKMI